jgi:CHAT domain-containing protein/Tfp pilus assembly protein PilF
MSKPRILSTVIFVAIAALAHGVLAQSAPPLPASQGQAATKEIENRIKVLDELAQTAWKTKDWPRVVDLYSKAIELDPKYAKRWTWRGAARSELGLHELAVADRRKAVELEPGSSDNHSGLCWSLILGNRPREAQPACEKALTLDPQSMPATVNLGHTYLLQNDKERAWRWYEQTIGLIQDEEQLREGLLDDFNIFEKKGWQVQLVREARFYFEPRARRYLEVQTKAQALMKDIQAADQAEDRARELELRQQYLTFLSPWLAQNHPRRVMIENVIIDTRKQLGEKLAKAGQYSQAVPHYLAVLQAKEQPMAGKPMKDQGDLIVPLNNLASAYQDSGNYPSALPLFKRALVIAEEARGPEHPSTGTRLNNLAGLYESMGQYAQALPLYQRALAISEKANGPEHPSTGTSLNNLAYLYESMGQYTQALPLYQRALAISEKAEGPEHPSTGINLNNLAELYRAMGQYALAQPLYQRTLAISEKAEGPEHPSTGTRLNNLALLYKSKGQYAQALPLYQRALAISEKAEGPEHPNTGNRLNNLANLKYLMGQYAEALPLYARALSIADRAGMPELTWTLQGNLMYIHGTRHEGAEAASLYQPPLAIWYGKQAVNTLQSVRGNMQGLDKDLQKGFLEKNQQTYQTLANLLIDAGRIPEAEQILAMLKERELGELVRSSAADAQKTQADLVGVEKRASAQMAELTARGVREATELAALEKRAKEMRQVGTRLGAEDEARRQALLTAAEAWRAEFQRYTSSLSELFAQSARSQERKDAENNSTRLQAKVALDGAGAVGLHYVVTDERIAIIVATPRASFGRFSPIKRTELNRQINALRQAMVAKTDTRAPAQALWNALIAPVQADIEAAGAKTLVLSLTDTLRYLPFAALQNPQGRYLVEDMALSLWAQAADVTPTPSTQGWQVAALGLTQAREGFSALPAVRGELQGIVKTDQSPQGVLPGRISLDEQFNRQRLEDSLGGQTNVVHIASHFDFKPGDESRSVLLLGHGDSLSLGKLAVMDFTSVEQLTLSACDTATGGGTNENGAEVEGLAATVLRQQAKSVLATLWKVADDSTAQLMQDFYRQRAQDKPPSRAQALRAAQLALIRGQSVAQVNQETARGASRADAPKEATAGAAPTDPNRLYAHPYYWAPFVLSGSWL